jgi:glycosyltransferase involved in cell wall biosynthesis
MQLTICKVMGKTENRILLFIKVPPPITGATLMNKYVFDSRLLKEKFIIRSIQISYAKSVKELGKHNGSKIIRIMKILFKLIYESIFHRPRFIYFQISPLGIAFYRDLIFVSIMKLFHIKIVYHLHGKGIKQKVANKFHQILYKYAFRHSEIICLSPLLINDIEDVYNEHIHIVNNGISDISGGKISFSRQKQNQKDILILFLSNLIITKGILDFIESLKILSDKNIGFASIIIGAESDISSKFLTDKLLDYQLTDKVSYLGSKYGSEKSELLSSCDILVFPTSNDVWGNVILEAMQFAKPVIATREGAIPEIVDDGKTGFLVDKHCPEQIAEKLEILINSPKLCKIMGEEGRKKFLKKYTLEIFESNLNDVFEEILGK